MQKSKSLSFDLEIEQMCDEEITKNVTKGFSSVKNNVKVLSSNNVYLHDDFDEEEEI